MTKDEYATYLQSEHWQTLRKELLDEIPICGRCSLPRWLAELVYGQDLHVHHKHYASLGNEEWDDLEILCRRCHEVETFGRSELRAPREAKCEACGATHWNYRSSVCATCNQVFGEPYLHYLCYNAQMKIMESINWSLKKKAEKTNG